VNPFAKWNEDAGINISNWNLTWSVTKFDETTATFKLVFDSPNFISKMEVQDVLYMNVILPWTFLSQMGAPVALGPGPVSIGIQLADNNLNRGMNSSTEGSKTIMMVTLIVSLLLNVFMSGIMHHMLSMINSLQIILHLPIMNVVFPAITLNFFKVMIPIAMFDILNGLEFYENIFAHEETAVADNIRA
jgi:hypothetical protein